VTFPSITALQRTASQLQSLALTVVPHGGQRSARRNAWAAMSADAIQSRARREAEAAVARAVAMMPPAGAHAELATFAAR
jgi:hypothetical protein